MNTTRINRHLAMFIATIMALTLWAGFPLTASAAETLPYGGLTYTYAEGTAGSTATSANNVLTLKDGAIGMLSGETTTARVEIEAGATVQLTLNGVNITGPDVADQAPISVRSGANATIILSGENTLTAKNTNAGLRVEPTASLTIEGDGKLTAKGGNPYSGSSGGAGIGGMGVNNAEALNTGTITIQGDVEVVANGGVRAAGIGGGGFMNNKKNYSGEIIIKGGTVTATTVSFGAGIGGGADSINNGSVSIENGVITATGGENSTGIGSGRNSADNGNISIKNAIIFANSISNTATHENAVTVIGSTTTFYDASGSTPGTNTVTLTGEYTILAGKTLTIPAGKTLVIDEGATLNVLGTLTVTGTLTGDGTLTSDKALNVSLTSIDVNGAYTYDGTEQTPDLTVKLAGTTLTLDEDYTISTTNSVNAGTAARYTITGKSPSYSGTKQGTFTIGKATGASASAPTKSSRTHNTVTLNPVSINGANPGSQTVEYGIGESSDASGADWQTGPTFSGLSSNTPYYFFARAKENDNYFAGAPSSGTQITTQIAVVNIAHNNTVTYNPSGINLIGTDGLFEFGNGAGTPTYTKENGSTGTGNIDDGVLTVASCGTFVIGLTTAKNEEYAAGEKVTATLTVNRASQAGIMIKEEENDLTGKTDVAKSRDDLSFDLAASGGQSGGAYTWSSSKEQVATVTETGATTTVTIGAAGNTVITVKKAGNANYNDGSASFTLVVSEATSNVTLTAMPAQLTYGNTTTLTAAVAKVGSINPTGTVTFYQGDGTDTPLESDVTLTDVGGVMTAEAQVELDAGTYGAGGIAIHAEYAGDTNYQAGSGSLADAYEVGKAGQDAVTVHYGQEENVTSLAKTYGDAAFELTAAGGSGTGTYAWASSEDEVATVTDTDGTTTVTIRGFGTANITLSRNGDDNHNATTGGENATVVLTVNPKDISDAVITIEDATWTYDGGDKEPGVVSVTLDEDPLTETADYTVSYAENRNAGDAASVIITGTGNYTGEASTTFTIGPKPVTFAGTVTATKTYDGNPGFNATHMTITGADSFGASDIVDSDEVELDKAGVTGALTSANAQTGATLELQEDFSLTGPDAKNYILSAQPTVMASITRAAGSFGSPPAINTTYTSGLTLADLNGQLPGGYAWLAPGTALTAGDGQTFAAVYMHPSGNYTPASGNITVNVAKDTDGDGGSVIVPPGSQIEEEGDNIKVTLPDGGGTVTVSPGSTVMSGENEGEIEVTLPGEDKPVVVPPGSTVMPSENKGEIEVTLPGEDEPVVVPPGSTVMPGENESEIEVTLPGDGGTVIVPPGSTVDAEGNVTAPPDNPPATTGSWVYEDGVWKYLVGGVAQTGWLYDTSYKAWFYFAENGIMQTGWVYDQNDKAWYYLASNGKMVAGKWLHDTDGRWYYLSGNGKMLTGKQTIGGKAYTFKSNGVWVS